MTMNPKVKELWEFLEKLRDDESLTTEDRMIIIGVLKCGESAMMLSCKGPLIVPEEKK